MVCPRTRRLFGYRRPRGATLVEVAITLSLLISLLVGMVDVGYGVFQQHVLTQSTRQLARKAIVRGALATRLEQWGPQSISAAASQTIPPAVAIAPSLVGLDRSNVNIQLDWIDQTNDPRLDGRVRVRMSTVYRPIMTSLVGSPQITLTAESTMYVAH